MGILEIVFKNPPSPSYAMLLTHNIAWHKFCTLFLNDVKREKGVEKRKLS